MGNGKGHSEAVRKYLCAETMGLWEDPSEESRLAVSRDEIDGRLLVS